MRITTRSRRNVLIATAAAAALTITAAGPAAAGLGGGPGGPVGFLRYTIGAYGGACDWSTGQDSFTAVLGPSTDYPNWQYVGVYYQEKAPGSSVNLTDVSHATEVDASWIGEGSAIVYMPFEVPPLPSGYTLEVDFIDLYPNDGYGFDAVGLTGASVCFPDGIVHSLGAGQAVHAS